MISKKFKKLFKNKKILVTGGTGLIGRELVKYLQILECNIAVVSIDKIKSKINLWLALMISRNFVIRDELSMNIISNCNDEKYTIVKKLYKEQTNVFAYYIIVAILIANFNNFILWCVDNNTNLFDFKKTNASTENFVTFIYKNYKNNELLKMIVGLEKRLENRTTNDELLLTTMRMTVIGGNM